MQRNAMPEEGFNLKLTTMLGADVSGFAF